MRPSPPRTAVHRARPRAGSCTSPTSPPGRPATAELARPLPPPSPSGVAGPLWTPPGRGDRPRPRRPVGGRRHRHVVGQVALLPGADRRGRRGARCGPAPRSCCSPRRRWPTTSSARSPRSASPGSWPGAYDGDASPEERTWIRKQRVGGAHQPRDAARRAAPAPRAVGHVPRPAPLRRGRRAAHLPRRLRQPRRAAAAPAAPPGRPPRRRPGVHLLARPRSASRSGWPPALTGVDGRRRCIDDGSPRGPRIVALWQPPLLDADTGCAGLGPPRGGRASSPGSSTAGAPPSASPAAGGAPRSWPPTSGAGCPGRSPRRVPRLPGRLPRRGAPRHRGRAVRRAAHRRGGHLGPRARHRRRGPRRGGARRVPRHHRLVLAAGRAGGPVAAVRVGRRAGGRAATSSTSGSPPTPTSCSPARPEPAVVNPANPFVLDPHLRCAAHELPLTHDDAALVAGRRSTTACAGSSTTDELARAAPRPPQRADRRVGRHAAGRPTGSGCATRRGPGADRHRRGRAARSATSTGPEPPSRCTPGASYLHQGQHWRVVELDLDAGRGPGRARRRRHLHGARDATRQVRLLDVDADASRRARPSCASAPSRCTSTVVGLPAQGRAHRRAGGHASRSTCRRPRSSPARVWYVVDADAVADGRPRPGASCPARCTPIEHAAIGMLPLFAICDRWDVGGVSTARHADTGLPTIVDLRRHARRGGRGRARLRGGRRHLAATLRERRGLPVRRGCPSCVQSPKCGNGNEHLDKAAAGPAAAGELVLSARARSARRRRAASSRRRRPRKRRWNGPHGEHEARWRSGSPVPRPGEPRPRPSDARSSAGQRSAGAAGPGSSGRRPRSKPASSTGARRRTPASIAGGPRSGGKKRPGRRAHPRHAGSPEPLRSRRRRRRRAARAAARAAAGRRRRCRRPPSVPPPPLAAAGVGAAGGARRPRRGDRRTSAPVGRRPATSRDGDDLVGEPPPPAGTVACPSKVRASAADGSATGDRAAVDAALDPVARGGPGGLRRACRPR